MRTRGLFLGLTRFVPWFVLFVARGLSSTTDLQEKEGEKKTLQ